MKVQVTLLVNVDITRSEYARDEGSTDDDVIEALRKGLDDGDLSFDDLMEQGSDYTVTVVKGLE